MNYLVRCYDTVGCPGHCRVSRTLSGVPDCRVSRTGVPDTVGCPGQCLSGVPDSVGCPGQCRVSRTPSGVPDTVGCPGQCRVPRTPSGVPDTVGCLMAILIQHGRSDSQLKQSNALNPHLDETVSVTVTHSRTSVRHCLDVRRSEAI